MTSRWLRRLNAVEYKGCIIWCRKRKGCKRQRFLLREKERIDNWIRRSAEYWFGHKGPFIRGKLLIKQPREFVKITY